MKTSLRILVLAFLLPLAMLAGNEDYTVASMPEELKKDANAVIRKNVCSFTIESVSSAALRVHYVVTLLNQKAADLAEIEIPYDKNTQVYGPHLKIFNSVGTDITYSIKNRAVKDESAISDASLYEDDRVRRIAPEIPYFPITIEYKYEIFYNGVIFSSYPQWLPVRRYNTALEYANLKVLTPVDLRPRTKEFIIPECAVVPIGSNSVSLEWTLEDFKAVVREPFSPPVHEIMPYVMVSPSQLRARDFQNEFREWPDFAKFISFLGDGRRSLPPATIVKMQELVRDCPDELSKIRKIYNYLQKQTRYISIQVGIGGWQPSPAEFVDKKGYGDCKGLVNYMQALLQAVGIKSHYTLVKAGSNTNPILADFPGNYFNHIILCVPQKNDTLWLECTDPHQPFGYLGSFTHNRAVLPVDGAEGRLVRTPVYGLHDNVTRRNILCSVSESGDASLQADIYESAIAAEYTYELYYESVDEQHKQLKKESGLADCEIKKLNIQLEGDKLPVARTSLELGIRGYASKSNNRSFIPAVILGRFNEVPQSIGERKFPVVVQDAYTEQDTIRMKLPENSEIEFTPENLNENTAFGKYSLHTIKEGNSLLIFRSLELYSNRYPPETFKDFQAFLRKVAKNDQSKIVIRSTI